jgi:hypothetical protein
VSVLRDAVRMPAHSIETLAILAPSLDDAGIRWWIDYGTLLGFVREGRMIPYDSDIDLGVMADDMAKVLALAPALRKAGLDTCFHVPGLTRYDSGDWFHVTRRPGNPNGVDVFPWYVDGPMFDRRRYCVADRRKGQAFPALRLLPLSRATWEGIEVNVPADPEWFAAHRYGADWRAPVDYRDGVPALTEVIK